MNAFNMAQTAYSNSAAPTRTPRGTEYDAFARITHRMKSAAHSDDFTALASALYENNRLWTLLAADVSDQDNALPAALRGRIFYLYEFTVQHSRKVLRKEDSIEALIDINTSIMRGLRSKEGAL